MAPGIGDWWSDMTNITGSPQTRKRNGKILLPHVPESYTPQMWGPELAGRQVGSYMKSYGVLIPGIKHL